MSLSVVSSYKKRTIKENPFIYTCILGNCQYMIENKDIFYSHIKSCSYNYMKQLPIDISIDYNISLEDDILQTEIMQTLTNSFIETNELEQFNNKDGVIIRKYILNKLKSLGCNNKYNPIVYMIYGFFFKMTEKEEDTLTKIITENMIENIE